jgi:putative ABC transport system ATP-binding protein
LLSSNIVADATSVDMAIRASNVTLSLGAAAAPVHILRGVNLEIPYGASVALLGPSGSGKSSLMAVLAGLERASGGSVHVDGIDFTNLDEDGLARARRGRIGIVLQAFHLLPTMTALENVAIPLELAGHPDPFDKAEQELGFVGLGHRTGHYPSQLSGGEQQRVAIARAMAADPKIIFADEPTGNLDGATGHSIIDLLFHRHAKSDATLLIITHDPELAQRCERVIAMQDGLVVDV